MKRFVVCALSFIAAAALTGCSLAPRYETPAFPVEQQWPSDASASDETGAIASELEWKAFFLDPTLQRLIEDALEHNRDLRVAALNIERARAQYGIQRADLLPGISASGAHTSRRVAEELSSRGTSYVGRQYTVDAGIIGYEIDFFGRVRNLSEAALETYLATEEAKKSAQISLVSQVATAYLGLVADRELLGVAKNTLASQQATYTMIKRRHEEGVSSELDLWRAETTVDTARADIARYTAQVAEDLNALSVLVGRTVRSEDIPASSLAEMAAFPQIQAGLPSTVLLGRPDIVRQEHLLKAANANIGAARANFFPSISLTATLGRGSVELDHLFEGGGRTWAFSPSISLPIFTMGRNISRLRMSEADQKIAVANYEKAIQQAFREVANALTLRTHLEERLAAQKALLKASTEAYRLSDARYARGVDSYLSVLDAQRSMYSAQQAAVTVSLLRDVNLVELYKVLGGGLK